MLEKTDVGGRIYVWSRSVGQPSNGATAAVISSHGGIPLINRQFPHRAGDFDFYLQFYTPHGFMVRDPGVDRIMKGEVRPIEGCPSSQLGPDYVLAKFQGRHSNGREDYDLISALSPSDKGLTDLRHRAQHDGFAKKRLEELSVTIRTDIITIRNRMTPGGGSIRLSEVLKLLDENGFRYPTIHCAFCRGGGVPD